MSNRVIIAGGGVGGLAIAHRFKKHGITFHIYERNDGQNYRAQDYRIRVARDAVTSLQWRFDEKTWRSFELTCGETRLVPVAEIDASAHVCEAPNADASLPQDAAKPYTVDRTTFREVMLRDLGAHVSWRKEAVRYEETSSGVEVDFSDGSSDKGGSSHRGRRCLQQCQAAIHSRPQNRAN